MRIAPALNIGVDEIEEALAILDESMKAVAQ